MQVKWGDQKTNNAKALFTRLCSKQKKKGEKTNIAQLKKLRAHLIRIAKKPISSNHMSPDSQLFASIIPTTHTPLIQTANSSHLAASHTGSVSTSTLSLSDTYLIPNLILNLISVGQLCELGFDLWFGSSGCRVQDPRTNQVLGTGRRVGRMFELTSLHLPTTLTPPPSYVAHTASVFPLSLWHLRLGHVSIQKLRTLISSGFLG
jgi:hypothetical protein